jgi:hypothetical protein
MEHSADDGSTELTWYHYLAALLAGMFLVNAVPHFVNGVSGQPFPSPFADPPGQGLSPPVVNVLWGSFNLVVGYLLASFARLRNAGLWPRVIAAFGGIVTAYFLASHFGQVLAAS